MKKLLIAFLFSPLILSAQTAPWQVDALVCPKSLKGSSLSEEKKLISRGLQTKLSR